MLIKFLFPCPLLPLTLNLHNRFFQRTCKYNDWNYNIKIWSHTWIILLINWPYIPMDDSSLRYISPRHRNYHISYDEGRKYSLLVNISFFRGIYFCSFNVFWIQIFPFLASINQSESISFRNHWNWVGDGFTFSMFDGWYSACGQYHYYQQLLRPLWLDTNLKDLIGVGYVDIPTQFSIITQ